MNELNKLIEQYESENPGKKAQINFGYGHRLWTDDFVLWLVESFMNSFKHMESEIESLQSLPTCGKEQRKFLDEVEKGEWYDTSDDDPEFITKGIMVGQETFLFKQDFESDLQKVIKGE